MVHRPGMCPHPRGRGGTPCLRVAGCGLRVAGVPLVTCTHRGAKASTALSRTQIVLAAKVGEQANADRAIAPTAAQMPVAVWISGSESKFMPKKPVIRFSGRNIGGQHRQRAHDVVGAVAERRKVHLHRGLGGLLEAPHMATTRVRCVPARRASARRSSSRSCRSAAVGLGRPLVERVDPFLDGAALVFAGVLQHVQRVARFQQHRPVVEAALRVEQLAAAACRAGASAAGASPGSCPPCG